MKFNGCSPYSLTGASPGEIANLSIDDIDWRKGTLTLKGTKSRRHPTR
jgi:integrase